MPYGLVIARVAPRVTVPAVTFAESEELVLAVTATVFTTTVIEVSPSGTVTVAGREALIDELARVSSAPPAGAGPVRVIVISVEFPPTTVAGFRATVETFNGIAVKVAVRLSIAVKARTTAEAFAVTYGDVNVNAAVVSPAGTVMEAGTAIRLLRDRSPTTVPPAGAGAERVTMPLTTAPPLVVAGEKRKPVRRPGVTRTVVRRSVPPYDARTAANVSVVTDPAVAVKVADVVPSAMSTLAGTDTAESVEDNATVMPPAGAAVPRVTVPVAVRPERSTVGVTTNVLRVTRRMLSAAMAT